MKEATPVTRALDHVRAMFPDVTHVVYTREGKWVYMSDDGDSPSFNGRIAAQDMDIELLEEAADHVSNTCGFPAVFCVEAQ